MSNINLDGSEITIIKTLGFGGTPILGLDLKARMIGMGNAELFDILKVLSDLGYVCSDSELAAKEDIERTSFFVNPGYAKELKEALDPTPKPPTKRVRRE